jgi:hypothetical protein
VAVWQEMTGERRLHDVALQAGFRHFRRATETKPSASISAAFSGFASRDGRGAPSHESSASTQMSTR